MRRGLNASRVARHVHPELCMNNAKKTWVLVAHRTGATLYESHGPGAPLTVREEIDNPSGRLKTSELGSDRPGRAYDRIGGGRHAMSSEQSPVEHIEQNFASQLADRLERGRNDHEFDRLVLVASPKLLGKLNHALPTPLRALVLGTLAKDLARTDVTSLRAHLEELPSF
jgi:protein required for attachment to host cells